MNAIPIIMFSMNLRSNSELTKTQNLVTSEILMLKLPLMKLLLSMQNQRTATMVSQKDMDLCELNRKEVIDLTNDRLVLTGFKYIQ